MSSRAFTCTTPLCEGHETKVVDSRPNEFGIRRRRRCEGCGARFTTYEMDADEVERVIEARKANSLFERLYNLSLPDREHVTALVNRLSRGKFDKDGAPF